MDRCQICRQPKLIECGKCYAILARIGEDHRCPDPATDTPAILSCLCGEDWKVTPHQITGTREKNGNDLILCDKCGGFFSKHFFAGHYNVWHTGEEAITEYFRKCTEASRQATEEYWNDIYGSGTPNIGIWL